MEKPTHILFGTALGFILYFNGLRPEYAFLTAASAIIPDIDWTIDKVWISKRSIVRKVWRKAFGGRGFHRTLLHNLWVLMALDLSIYIYTGYNYLLLIGLTVGFLSHLILDSLTKMGIYWLWPYGDEKVTGKRHLHIRWRIRTGGRWERLLQGILVILLLMIINIYDPSLWEYLLKWLEWLKSIT